MDEVHGAFPMDPWMTDASEIMSTAQVILVEKSVLRIGQHASVI